MTLAGSTEEYEWYEVITYHGTSGMSVFRVQARNDLEAMTVASHQGMTGEVQRIRRMA